MRTLRVVVLMAVCASMFVLTSCTTVSDARKKLAKLSPVFSNRKRPLGPVTARSVLPDLELFPLMEVKDAPVIFQKTELSQYMDKGTDIYTKYGFAELATVALRFTNTSDTVFVEVFDMGTSSGAFGVYSTTRPGRAEYLNIGFESWYSAPRLLMHRGQFLVRLVGSNSSHEMKETLKQLAIQSDWQIPKQAGAPGRLGLLTSTSRVEHSERYTVGKALGYGLFKRAWLADYMIGGDIIEMALLAFASTKDSRKAYNMIYNRMKGRKPRRLSLANECHDGKIGRDLIMICRQGRYVIHMTGAERWQDYKSLASSELLLLVDDVDGRRGQ